MGGVLSRLGEDVTDIAALLRDAFATGLKYRAVLQRASSDPGLPVERPTQPYWMLDPPHREMLDLQGEMPREADVVIVGSGITGAAAARTILELAPGAMTKPRIVVLEARQLCSGATGRNGGHVKCTVYSEYARLEKKLGRVSARKIVAMQMSHLALLSEVGGQVPEGEVRRVETADLFIHQEDFDEAKGEVEILKQGMPGIEVEVWEGAEARKKFGVNEQVVGAVSYTAGALWPFRLVTGVWHRLVHEHPNLTISTHTSVTAVTENDDASSQRRFIVRTSRGDIQTRHVLHATNGFASHLVPLLRGRLTGAVGHMTAQRPGDEFPARHGDASWSVMYSPGFDYVTQRPDREDGSQGDIMLGGALSRSREGGLDQFGIWDDGRLHTLPLMHLRGSMATVFEPQWGAGSELKNAWTGIMGFTGDTLPFVGPLPTMDTRSTSSSSQDKSILNSSGEWIAAGFNGEGMVWAWLSGTAIALMILGKDKDHLERGVGRPGGRLDDWFPREECAIDSARLKRADLRNLRELM